MPLFEHLSIVPLRAFSDNYIWLIHNESHCAVIDPGMANPVLKYTESRGLIIDSIWITHHHSDHTQGIHDIQQRYPEARVYGQNPQRVPEISFPLDSSSQAELLGYPVQVLELPGHTLDHLGYVLKTNHGPQHLFCGDTLFSAGCGRIFEGTVEQMYTSLQTISMLPENTIVYPAHEYTRSNLVWAVSVDPSNIELQHYYAQITRSTKECCTLPTSIAFEKKINPFLRTHDANLKQSVCAYSNQANLSDIDTFALLRTWKNNY